MTTVNITAGYNLSFDVLTDEQKEKAVEMVREREENSGDNFFAESVIEYYKEYVFPEYGLEDTDVHWSGFWCQGDGASISAENVNLEKFLRKVKSLTKFRSIRHLFGTTHDGELSASVERNTYIRYSHENTVNGYIDTTWLDLTAKQENKVEDLEELITETVRELSRKVYVDLEEAYYEQFTSENLIGLIEANDFVIPEIQRPFVWKRSQVRDLIDSLYHGYPTGYIITWKNPSVRTKDGGYSQGKKVLIDGQQRITALMAAISGKEVLDEDFKKDRIKIAFNPLAADDSKRFAVQDASHLKDKKWIPDISVLFSANFKPRAFENEYAKNNPNVDLDELADEISKLTGIANRQIGVIELDHSLDIDEVTEIFIRINSKGTALSQSDFVMSKMAADTDHDGSIMRKAVDYFCHLAVKPEFYENLKKDTEFQQSIFADKIKWLANDYDDIYDPGYSDMLRVSFMHQFRRGKLADLVSLLSGRDFETKEFREDIVSDSYQKLEHGILNFINEYNFAQFILAIKGAGFISSKLLNSAMTLDFAYTLYLILLDTPEIPNVQIKRYVQKWFVLTTLTSRYIGSPESQMDRDMRSIQEKGFKNFLSEVEASALSDTFWTVTLPQNLETSSVNSPAFNVFLAAQVHLNCNSLLMNGIKVSDLITVAGDIHHIFPRAYLKKNGIDSKTKYNQVANYIYLDTQVNKAISDDAPCDYFSKAFMQCETKAIELGNICNLSQLNENLQENCIPLSVKNMDASSYEEFLTERRKLMASMMKRYYWSL